MKNQFYLAILIVALAVCGVVMFRPQVVDRVLGLLGVQNRETSSHAATEWDSVTTDTSQENESLTFGNAFAFDNASFGDNSDGFAVASRAQTAPQAPVTPKFGGSIGEPFQQYDNQYHNTNVNHSFDEGVAISGLNAGVNGDAMPDFSGYSASTAESQNPEVPGNGIMIQFAGPANPNASPGTSLGITVASDQNVVAGLTQPSLPNPAVSDKVIDLTDDAIPVQSMPQATPPVNNMHVSGNVPVPETSVVMPDPHFDGGFANYRSREAVNHSMTTSELYARMIPPAEAPPMNWSAQVNPPVVDSPAVGIAQPIVTQEQLSAENAVISVQGVVVPATPVTYPAGATPSVAQPVTPPAGIAQFPAPQWEIPQLEVPQSVPVMRETPLYIPSQGNAGQVPTMQPVLPPQQPQNPQPVAVANTAQHILPEVDQRAQYVPENIAEIETVFATEVLARVGSGSVIMTCDILADVRERLDDAWAKQYKEAVEEYGQKPSQSDERAFKAEGMQILFEEALNEWIDLHVKYLDMTLNFPGEQFEEFRKQMSKSFEGEVLPKMMAHYGVTNRYELNKELMKFGTTLDRKKENFLFQQLAMEWYGQLVKPPNKILNFDDMVGYYEQHKEEKYKILGQAKWEELAAFFSETASEQEAYAKIVELGNRVQKGEPFAEVAKQGSQGLTAWRGGERETTVGSLRTPTLEKAIFSLPVGGMSRIIREDTGGSSNAGYYIIRVLERQDTHYIPFDQVQSEIEKMINDERLKREQDRVLTEIRNRYPVAKTNNLQQIIQLASEAERNLPVNDSPEYHERLIAKAERLAPAKKTPAGRQGQSSLAQQQNQQQHSREGVRIAGVTARSEIQSSTTSPSQEPNLEPASPNAGQPKKKTFWQSINLFR